jgi:branched-chain amino acid transport system substrate-binding protein
VNRSMLAAAFVVGLAMAACNSRPSRVVVGIGLNAAYHSAVTLAAREINARGGIGGVPLEFVGLEWDGSVYAEGPAALLKWTERFNKTRDLVAIIGHSDSASTLSAAASYNRVGIPQLVTIATNPAITNIGVWTYRLCLSDAAQGPALAEYAVNDWKKRRIAIIFVNDDYGRGLAQLFEKRVRELGAEIVGSVMHRDALDLDDREMIRSVLGNLKKGTPPDLIALFQRAATATWTLEAIRDAGIVVDKLGGDSLSEPAFSESRPELTEGIRVSLFLRPEPDNRRALTFARDFRAITGRDPGYGETFAYDAVYLLRDAVLGGGYSRAGVKAYLDRLIRDRTQVRGVGGSFTLGSDHDARRPFYVAEIRDGKFRALKTLSVE